MEPQFKVSGDYARLRPDTVQWVDLRGFLFSGRCDVFANPDPGSGFVMRCWDFPMVAVAGSPLPEMLRDAVVGVSGNAAAWAGEGSTGECYLLAAPESVASVATVLTEDAGWSRRTVSLHRLRAPVAEVVVVGGSSSVPAGFEVRVAAEGWTAAGWDLGHLPTVLLREYSVEWLRGRPMAAAFSADGVPVSFCYSACSTETLWDAAVDTLADFRRRGLSGACFMALARQLASADGIEPVWGALDSNEASIRLAEKLGFVRAASLTSFVLGGGREGPEQGASRTTRSTSMRERLRR
jgi:hypothetical protein